MSRTFLAYVGAGALSALAVLAAPSAKAATRAEHTVRWYAVHPAERDALLRRCNDDRSLDSNGDCQNATAGARTFDRDDAGDSAFNHSVEMYRQNDPVRRMTLALCARAPKSKDSWCQAARQAQSEIH